MENPQYGDVIFSAHGSHNHYGICSGNNLVIHYWKTKNSFLEGTIQETDLESFLNKGTLHICVFNEITIKNLNDYFTSLFSPFLFKVAQLPIISWQAKLGGFIATRVINGICNYLSNDNEEHRPADVVFSANETVARAKSKIGTGDYNLFGNNCEHFAIWCKAGISKSEQVEKVKKIIFPF